MTKKQILKALAKYDNKLASIGCVSREYPKSKSTPMGSNDLHSLSHCRWMILQMVDMIKKGKLDKVYRWLGFIQGCLWYSKTFSIKELKKHNKSK